MPKKKNVDATPSSRIGGDDEEETRLGRRVHRSAATYGSGKVFPELFQNDKGRLWTIRIDSKRLEKIESEDPDATRDEAAKELREIVNTIGRLGVWDFLVCRDPPMLPKLLAQSAPSPRLDGRHKQDD